MLTIPQDLVIPPFQIQVNVKYVEKVFLTLIGNFMNVITLSQPYSEDIS